MTIKMNRVWNFKGRPVRPLGLPAKRDKVVDGRLVTPAVLRLYGSHLVILDENTRTLIHRGAQVSDRELSTCRPRVQKVGRADVNQEARQELTKDLKNAADTSGVAPEPKTEEPKVEAPKEEPKAEPKTEEPKVEAPKEEPKAEAKAEEPKVEAKKPARKKRASKKKAAKKTEAPKEAEMKETTKKPEEQVKEAAPEEGLTKLGVTSEDLTKHAADLEAKNLDSPFDL